MGLFDFIHGAGAVYTPSAFIEIVKKVRDDYKSDKEKKISDKTDNDKSRK